MRKAHITVSDIVVMDDLNRYSLMPRHEAADNAVAYLKGHNGHYYLIRSRYGWRRLKILRLYTKNQIRESNDISISIDDEDAFNDRGQLTVRGMTAFVIAVSDHTPYHYTPSAKTVDAQRSRCYQWEATFGHKMIEDGTHLGFTTSENAVKYVEAMCKAEGVKVPHVTFNKSGTSWAKGSQQVKFRLNEDGTISNKTIIHEVAHIVDAARGRGNDAGHGPSWVGIYIEMLVKFGGVNKAMLEQTARAGRVQFSYAKVKEAA